MATLKMLTSALSLGLGIGIRFSKGIVYKLLVMAGKEFTVWLNEITIYGKGYDFPSQVSNTAPTFLLGANATNPAELAINAQGRALLNATTATAQRAAAIVEPNKYAALSYTEHFLGITSLVGGLATTVASSGTTTAVAVDGRVGVIRVSCGTAATNNARANLGTGTSDNCLAVGVEPLVFVAVCAPSVNLFTVPISGRINVGFVDTDGSSLPVDGAYFYSNNGAAWECIVRSNSSESSSPTGLSLVLDEWHTFAIRLTSSLVEFYIDGALVASVVDNIPVDAGRLTGIGIKSQKTSSNALAAAIDVDLIHVVIPCTRIPA